MRQTIYCLLFDPEDGGGMFLRNDGWLVFEKIELSTTDVYFLRGMFSARRFSLKNTKWDLYNSAVGKLPDS
jgi:hypothetical protein